MVNLSDIDKLNERQMKKLKGKIFAIALEM